MGYSGATCQTGAQAPCDPDPCQNGGSSSAPDGSPVCACASYGPTCECQDSDADGQCDHGDPDIDGDGVVDSRDRDADGDGVANEFDGVADTDCDGIPGWLDADSDGDGVPDATEAYDFNADGVADISPSGDADGDGIDDAFANVAVLADFVMGRLASGLSYHVRRQEGPPSVVRGRTARARSTRWWRLRAAR